MTRSPFLHGSKALIEMVHLPPMPGSTNYTGQPFDHIVDQAVVDARALESAGFDAAIVQNTHDLPTTAAAPVEVVAHLAAIGRTSTECLDCVRRERPQE